MKDELRKIMPPDIQLDIIETRAPSNPCQLLKSGNQHASFEKELACQPLKNELACELARQGYDRRAFPNTSISPSCSHQA